MTLTTLFIAQALGVDLSFGQQLTILIVAMLISKGASGVAGAGFITLAIVNRALVPGMAIVFSIDKFMSEVRALTNITGNGVATMFVSWWEGELEKDTLRAQLNAQINSADMKTPIVAADVVPGGIPKAIGNPDDMGRGSGPALKARAAPRRNEKLRNFPNAAPLF